MMRSRLSVRLLAVSLSIAISAVLATAWLTSQAATERVVGALSGSLEADGFIYSQLTSHASVNADWDRAAPLLAQLSRRTGRAIALRSEGGSFIAGAVPSEEPVSEVDLHTMAAATIDPFAPLLNVVPARLGPLELGTDATPWGRLRPDDIADLREQTLATGACLVDRGVAADVVAAPGELAMDEEGLFLDDPIPPSDDAYPGDELLRVFVGPEAPMSLVGSCSSLTNGNENETEERQLLDTLHQEVTACLDAAGIHRVDEVAPSDRVGNHLRAVALPSSGQQATAERCEVDARRSVLDAYVAPPAQLYLWDPQSGGLWSRTGIGRLALALAAVLIVTIGLSVTASRRLVRPLQVLTDAADRLAAGGRGVRTNLDQRDEIGRLATSFDIMADSLRREEERRRSMVSDVAHELRNPLTNLRGHLDAAAEHVIELDERLVRSLQEETDQLERIVEDLHQLALSDAGDLRLERHHVDAAELVHQVVRAHQATARHLRVDLHATTDGPLDVHLDPARIRQALSNLVHNALRYTPAGGAVEVSGRTATSAVQLAVTDTGVGIAAEDLPHVFERFYRADPSRSRLSGGSGLGLALVHSLVTDHDGTVDVHSEPGRGTTFVIELPRPDGDASVQAATPREQ